MRRAAKVDGCQEAIVAALRKAGASVQSLAAIGNGCPDLIAGMGGETWLFECKDPTQPKSKQKPNTLQAEWHARWKGRPVAVVLTPQDALKAIGVSA